MYKLKISKNKKIILSALLLSFLIILSRFLSIKTTFLVISLSFIPIMIAGIYLGPIYTGIVAGLGDLIGAILFPFGSYFPGFTISAVLMGLVYGEILYKNPNKKQNNKKFIFQLILSSIIVLIGIKVFLESVWLHLLYGKAYVAVISARILTQTIMLPIQVIVIFVLEKILNPIAKKYLYDEEKISIEEYLNNFDKITKEPSLDAMEYFMNKFSNPEKKLKIIHIAGTNGKGSVAEMLNNCLINCGYKVRKICFSIFN